jgi:hypothetical protein
MNEFSDKDHCPSFPGFQLRILSAFIKTPITHQTDSEVTHSVSLGDALASITSAQQAAIAVSGILTLSESFVHRCPQELTK